MNTVEMIKAAGAEGKLLETSVKNLLDWTTGDFLPDWALDSIEELVKEEQWDELNDRFYQFLAFGTGGMRNRTIGNYVTGSERGTPNEMGTPSHPAVGTAVLNDFNIIRATVGLYRYCDRVLKERNEAAPPRLVIAHDVRHFSRYFCELTASTWTRLGGEALIFDGPRSTPQLSFTVRNKKATAGIVITASHNPSHDNGYKVYFEDGAQVVFPHAEGIINEVYQVKMDETPAFLEVDISTVEVMGEVEDAAYMKVLKESLLDPTVFKQASPKIVFSPIHGTGGISAPVALESVGLKVDTVAEQMVQDGRFPTVKSPNPENAEALNMAIEQARETGADIVMATDPDADRMGVAVRNADGELELLSGNMIGSLMAAFRIEKMKAMGIIPEAGTQRAALIKTFVTTPLQSAIAAKNGLKVIDTLTGFKWIGEKLLHYEEALKEKVLAAEGRVFDYDNAPLEERRRLLLEHSTFYVFGGEESYGYMASDLVRDKDANAAVLMFAEMAATLQAEGKTILDYLDEVYLRYGYYLEDVINIYYEGASGASRISNILKSYRSNPPSEIAGFRVTGWKDFGTQTLHDADGKEIPKQDFYFIELDNGYSFAGRGSGTEPKIKFYIFAHEEVTQPGDLAPAKAAAARTIEKIKQAIEADARGRAGE
ncbi:phospho-sugar mutase [Puniceicoccales bacterium CK1056]|uniref:Phospho-sugar mutase n=1 Tax=Oceanipulchritudo coccoides TaxID=2706888 RepID=A0A6B2M3L6_9BACT|nr:phospho-sugar mutase [Oceanipulchritudo coccoides]NDV62694.1 phospho-sugar mutase [Oceanipulchritudo coccoides]